MKKTALIALIVSVFLSLGLPSGVLAVDQAGRPGAGPSAVSGDPCGHHDDAGQSTTDCLVKCLAVGNTAASVYEPVSSLIRIESIAPVLWRPADATRSGANGGDHILKILTKLRLAGVILRD